MKVSTITVQNWFSYYVLETITLKKNKTKIIQSKQTTFIQKAWLVTTSSLGGSQQIMVSRLMQNPTVTTYKVINIY